MASVSELKKLSRDLLNEFAVANGVEDAADETKYKDKAALAEVLSPKVTPEQLAEFKASKEAAPADPATDPANAPEGDANVDQPTPPAQDEENAEEQPTQPTDPETPADENADDEEEADEEEDPATQPPKDAVSAETLKVGDRVSYPHAESEGGRRVGTVRSVGEETASVVYYDGSDREFSLGALRKV